MPHTAQHDPAELLIRKHHTLICDALSSIDFHFCPVCSSCVETLGIVVCIVKVNGVKLSKLNEADLLVPI